jgi:hypothetical protein
LSTAQSHRRSISLLAQADDLLIFCLSTGSLNTKLATLERWCAKNFILVNLIKNIILIFGRTTLPPPTFHLGLTELSISTEEKYVRVNLRTDTQNMFKDHYKAKHAQRAIVDIRSWELKT